MDYPTPPVKLRVPDIKKVTLLLLFVPFALFHFVRSLALICFTSSSGWIFFILFLIFSTCTANL